MLKLTEKHIQTFLEQAKGKTIVAGYGSLLSQYSRQHFSQIDSLVIPVLVHNWERSWITRSLPEKQTYVGAKPELGACINACVLALDIDPSFQQREQDYRFTLLEPRAIEFLLPSELTNHGEVLQEQAIYICESLEINPANETYPVSYSYIHTCLLGAQELMGAKGIEEFFQYTKGWNSSSFINDSASPKYPRAAPLELGTLDIAALIKRHAN